MEMSIDILSGVIMLGGLVGVAYSSIKYGESNIKIKFLDGCQGQSTEVIRFVLDTLNKKGDK